MNHQRHIAQLMHHTSIVWSTGLEVCPVPAPVSSSASTATCCDYSTHAERTSMCLNSSSHLSTDKAAATTATMVEEAGDLAPGHPKGKKAAWVPSVLKLFQFVQHNKISAWAKTKGRAFRWFTREKKIVVRFLWWWGTQLPLAPRVWGL